MNKLIVFASVLIILWSLAVLYVSFQTYLYFSDQSEAAEAAGESIYVYTFKEMIKEAMS